MKDELIVARLREALPELLAIYLFGSHASGTATAQSDVDLAVLVAGKADAVRLWELAQSLALDLDADVDLIDLRSASTVMQYQVITGGRRLWAAGIDPDLFEAFVLSEKTSLDLARRELIADIGREGRIHGR